MKVGIISDSHDSERNVLKAIDIFNERKVEYVFHAGDIVSASTACLFGGLEIAKFIGVFGNCDSLKPLLEGAIQGFGGEIHDEIYKGEVGGRRIFMRHKPVGLDEAIGGDEYDVVIYGHTHTEDIRKVGWTKVINPGASTGREFGKAGVVILNLEDMNAERVSLA